MTLVLHNYFRSSSSIRVRAALKLKGIDYSYVPHHLRKDEQTQPDYLRLNPQGVVPTLVLEDGAIIRQSLAIIEYLEEIHPTPPLLPRDPLDRAHIRSIALAIACEIHPINNLRVLARLRGEFGADDAAVNDWFRHWVGVTFGPLETILASDPRRGKFCYGDTPGLADICIMAQCVNNQRFGVDMGPYPTLTAIFQSCLAVPAMAAALPAAQPDAE
jgi:maleylpyruvate isomerase